MEYLFGSSIVSKAISDLSNKVDFDFLFHDLDFLCMKMSLKIYIWWTWEHLAT